MSGVSYPVLAIYLSSYSAIRPALADILGSCALLSNVSKKRDKSKIAKRNKDDKLKIVKMRLKSGQDQCQDLGS